ncbi:MAG: DNA-3-methyladenine glycosylase [Nitrososphaeria archaeon]|nr:DNA-3-methyladenine glycosylase [Nitrososphaeria archaeon]
MDKILPQEFYINEPELVAKKLLGKALVRRLYSKNLIGKIVETEAYYSEGDPAFRKDFLPRILNLKQGTAFIYMVHANWLLNVIAYDKIFGGVLIRAIEPIEGVDTMRKFRGMNNIFNLTNGPGKLTKAMNITKDLNGVKVYDTKSKLIICSFKKEEETEIISSYRVGVKKDLNKKLRFFIKGNNFVSKLDSNNIMA